MGEYGHKLVEWGRAHPYMLGAIVFFIGILLLWWFGLFRRSSGSGTGDLQAYYNAETAGAQTAAQEYGIAQQTQASMAQTQAATTIATTQSNNELAAALAKIKSDQDVATVTSGNTLAATQAQFDYLTKAQLSQDQTTQAVKAMDVQNNYDIANIAAKQATDLAGISLQAHLGDVNAAQALKALDVQNNWDLASIAAKRATDLATITGAYDVQKAQIASTTQQVVANDQFMTAHEADVSNQVLAQLANDLGKNQAYYGYLTSKDTNATNQSIATINATAQLADTAAKINAATGQMVGIWSPTTGQITVNQSGYGGPIDPTTLAQIAANPFLIHS